MTRAGGSILIKGLYKRYTSGRGVVEVLRGLDLVVDGGQSIAVVGASGVGKSTLLYIIGALEEPSAGQVVVDGVELGGMREAQLAAFRNTTVGFVFQFHHLLADFTALENVMMPALIAGLPRAEARARALELLKAVGLEGLGERAVGQLSGGEQQRVAVARALVMRPKVVLADEPTGNLDEATAQRVGRVLVEINREFGTTLVVATHNTALAGMMQRRVRLAGGRAEEMDEA